MVVFILDIIFILVVAFSIFLVFKKASSTKTNYDVKTTAGRFPHVFSFICIALGVALNILSIVFYFKENKDGQYATCFCGLFFDIMGLILLVIVRLTYEAILDNAVIIKRFKTKQINIIDIAHIQTVPAGFIFFDKNFNKLFSLDGMTGKKNDFMDVLIKKSSELGGKILFSVNNMTVPLTNTENNSEDLSEKQTYELIGKEYRANNLNSNKEQRGVFFIFLFMALAMIGLSILIKRYYLILFVPLMFIGYGKINKTAKETKESQKKLNDYQLGVNTFLQCKKVKGYGKRKIKNLKLSCFIIGPLFLIIGLVCGLGAGLSKITPYSKMNEVTGIVEYASEIIDDDDTIIVLGIENDPIEYRLESKYYDYFDLEFFDDVKIGDKITIYVENDKPSKQKSKIDKTKEKYNNFYYLKANDIEYFSYKNYKDGFMHDRNIGIILGCVFASIGIGSFVVFAILYSKIKKEEKDEYLVIN